MTRRIPLPSTLPPSLFLLFLLAPLVACGDDGAGPGSTSLEVVSVSPESGSSTAETGTTVQAGFNQAIVPASLTPSTFSVTLEGTPLATSVGWDASSNTGTAVAPLLPDEVYEAEITTGVRTPADSTLSEAEGWLFSTRSWATTIADEGENVGTHTSLALDGGGGVHVMYRDLGNSHLKHATCTEACTSTSGWDTVTVDTESNSGEWSSLAIDGAGALHVAYHDVGNSSLKYAVCTSECTAGENWETVTVDNDGFITLGGSLALGSAGRIHVAYYESTSGDLKYATCSTDCTASESWDVTVALADGDVGRYTSLALDASGRLHVSYQVAGAADLAYATCAGNCTSSGSWQSTVVEDEGEVGRWTSIGVDGNGRIHVVHHDVTETDLGYATCASNCTSAASWQTTTADGGGTVGTFADLVLDGNGRIHVTHYDSSEGDLRYSTCVASCALENSWQSKAAISAGIVGLYPSLAGDGDGRIHVSYFDFTNGVLAYAE